jgi:two-component system alkaline phosphatase synthesis response regulator PhoP
VNEFTVDRNQYSVFKEGEKITLPRKEFELLALLASAPGKVFTRDEIFSAVWGDEVVVGDRTIDVHIRRIREKLGTQNIHTLKGVGYKYDNK